MSSPDQPSSHPLEYGAPQPRHWLRRHRPWIIAGALAIVAWLGWSSFQSLMPHLRLWYWEHQCLIHPVSPGALVYSSGPPAVCILSPEWSGLYKAGAYGHRYWPQAQNASVYFGERQASN